MYEGKLDKNRINVLICLLCQCKVKTKELTLPFQYFRRELYMFVKIARFRLMMLTFIFFATRSDY